ncbi:MAG: TonB-dependent receptor [Vicinamibacteraceae bacterium]
MFHHFRQAGLVAGLVLSLLPALVHGQDTGSLAGTATDPIGGIIAETTIDLRHEASRTDQHTVTDQSGKYGVTSLRPGRYTIRVTLNGFNPYRARVEVKAGTDTRHDIVLQIAAITEGLQVHDAEPPRIETAHPGLGLVIPHRDLIELPLNGRNFTQLGTLMPGVIAPPAALGGQAGDATPGGFGNVTGGFNVNGMRNQSNNFLLDGAPNNDSFNTGFVLRPPPDAIDEFRIFTHAFDAQYGRNAGAVVLVVTRAGSDQWRSSGWWFNRDDALEARNRFAVAKPALEQHQFGATAGGPVARNRAYAFGYYEGFRNRRGTTDTRVVPSAAQRAGDFSGEPAIRDPLTGQPFPGNVIPQTRLDSLALGLLDAYVPVPNQPGNRHTQSPDVVDRRHQGGARLDVTAAAAHKLLARVHAASTEQRNPLGPANFSPAGNVATARLFDALASEGWVIGPTAFNEVRVSVNRIDAQPNVTSGLDPRELGFAITPSNASALGLPNIGVNGFFTLGDAQQPFATRVNEVITIADDVTKTAGRHTIKGGAEVRRDRIALAFINRPNGNFTFNGQYTGNAAADFLLGLPQQYRQASGDPNMDGHTWTTSLFVQDEWRAARALTVTAGLRYERAAPFVERGDKLNAFHPGQQSTRFPAAPTGLVYPGDPGVPRGTYETDGNNLAPRLGAVWDVTGAGTTIIRGGWGLFYDTPAGQGDFFQSGTLAPPFQPLTEVNYSSVSSTHFSDPLDGATGGPNGFPPGLIFIGWGPRFTTPLAQHAHVSVQRDVADIIGLELAYVGSRARNLPIFVEVNPTAPLPTATPAPRPGPRLLPAFSLVRPSLSAARSSYDSLQASARVRRWRDLTALLSYTWGHAIDHVSGINIGGEARPMLPVSLDDLAGGEGPSIDAMLAREKGDALFDARHRIVLSANYVFPSLSGRAPLLRHALGGWSVNAIVQAQSGFALTVTEPVDVALTSLTNRPNVTCDPNSGGARTVAQWFDTRCFSQLTRAAHAGQIGNAGRGIVRGPGFGRTDLSLVRVVSLPRQQRIELRVEAFNLLEQARLGNPGLSIGTPTFGRITSADDGRIVQFGVKWGWR